MNHPYLPLTDSQRTEMLKRVGVSSFEDLLTDLPAQVRLDRPLNLPPSLTEIELRDYFSSLAAANAKVELSFLGAGAYQHYIPAIIDHLVNRSEFYTSYTPYQPEISQGILQAIFEYQTYIADLFGLTVANASLYDGPTALAEAVSMVVRDEQNPRILIPQTLNPRYKTVLKTYTHHLGVELIEIPHQNGLMNQAWLAKELQTKTAAVIMQSPNFFGVVENLAEIINLAKDKGSIPICYVEPLSLGLLEAPGYLGAEIVVGEGQPLGLPVSLGGPNLGLMAVSNRFMRKIPGRLVGETLDHHGKRAFVLTLQTREQHIRREKATSNICSNQALCALRAAVYLSIIGPNGIKEIAARSFNNAHYLLQELKNIGFSPLFEGPFLMEFAVKTSQPASFIIQKLIEKGIMPGFDLGQTHPEYKNALLICTTEIFSKPQLDHFVSEMRCFV